MTIERAWRLRAGDGREWIIAAPDAAAAVQLYAAAQERPADALRDVTHVEAETALHARAPVFVICEERALAARDGG